MTKKLIGLIAASVLLLATLPAKTEELITELPAAYTCDMLRAFIQKESNGLTNLTGAKIDIVDIWNVREVERTTTKLLCTGTALLSLGGEWSLEFSTFYKPETTIKWFADVHVVN